uniref:A-kinase-interacting protein 1 isoform X2 n=1 Tax=Jaculus jaculus TaxID=51337 RepID=UPI001E1B1428|nr:A-kinase-interacting protein 1 isoform X2 [Jaculus jaculus]
MESCWAAAVLNGVDRRALQRSARLGREVLERARRRAVNWHAQEHPRGSVGVLYREGPCQGSRSVPGPQRLLPAEREERLPTLSASFQTMAEFMDYTSSQCGKYYSSVLEEGGATHVYRYHRRRLPERHASSDADWGQNPGVPGYTLGSQVSEKSSLLGKDREKASLGLGSVCETSESAQEASQPFLQLSWAALGPAGIPPSVQAAGRPDHPLTKRDHC